MPKKGASVAVKKMGEVLLKMEDGTEIDTNLVLIKGGGVFWFERKEWDKRLNAMITLADPTFSEITEKDCAGTMRFFWSKEYKTKAIRAERERLLAEYWKEAKQKIFMLRVEYLKENEMRPILLRGSGEGLCSQGYGKYLGHLYKNNVYKFDRENYSNEEMIFQIMDLEEKERNKFEYLKRKHSGEGDGKSSEYIRERISEEVRITVWRRDGGACVRCSSRERLEYDHIVPVSKGGSNTARNIELLCEACNRAKSANIQ